MRADHRILPYTVNLALEAWAPGKGERVAEWRRRFDGAVLEIRTTAGVAQSLCWSLEDDFRLRSRGERSRG